MENKKAQDVTITTIIIIILALVVLVVLIFGFTTGWGNLWEKITGLSGQTNVDSVVQACGVVCTTGAANSYDYCTLKRTVKAGEAIFNVNSKGELINVQYDQAKFDEAKANVATAKTKVETVEKDAKKKGVNLEGDQVYESLKTALEDAEKILSPLAVKDKSKTAQATCKQLADEQSSLGFSSCGSITCT